MSANKGIKKIPENEINQLFFMPLNERMQKVDTLLNRLHSITPDIEYFDLDDKTNCVFMERYKDGK